MPFIKGQSGNPKGRPKGIKNRTPEALREFLQDFLFDRIGDVEAAWSNLDDNQKMMYFERISKHVVPAPVQEYMKLSDQDFQRIVSELIKRQQQ